MTAASVAALALGSWAFALASVTLWAAFRAALARPSRPAPALPQRSRRGRVLLVRPCAGSEPWLERALASTEHVKGARRARRELVVRFAVAGPRDGAYAVARRVASGLAARGWDAEVVGTARRATREPPPNGKVAQLACVERLVRDARRGRSERPLDSLLVVDSDVDLAGFDLVGVLVDPLARREADARWAPPVERASHGARRASLGDLASAAVLGASLHAFPLLARLDPGGLVGKCFGVRARALRDVGGFASLAHHLGEDMELARRLEGRGYRVSASREVAVSLARGRALGEVVARYGRWVSVLRAQRPRLLASYPLLFCAAPLLVVGAAILAVAADDPSITLVSLAIAITAVAARALAAAAAARASSGCVSGALALVIAPLADLVLALGFARALASRRVVWRGRSLRIAADGRISRCAEPRSRSALQPLSEGRAAR